MFASERKYPFVEAYVQNAPADRGVYVLWNGDAVLFVGRTGQESTIRSRLAHHFYGRSCPCSRKATHYGWEIGANPELREAELLARVKEATGELPPCNRHAG